MEIDRPIAIAVILIIIMLLIFFLVYPEYKTFESRRLDLAQKTAEFNAKYDYYATITKDYMDIQSRTDDFAKIDSALPNSTDFGQLVYTLQQKTAENGLIVKNFFLTKSSATSNQKDVKDITFTLSLTGDYASLQNFINSLEKSARIFEVTSISFGSSGSSSGQQQSSSTNFSLTITTHSY